MRKLAASVATALTLSLLGSASALADTYPQQGYGPGYDGQGQFHVDQAPSGPRGNWNGQPNVPLPPPPPPAPQGGFGGERGQQGGYHDQWSQNGFDDHGFGGERGDRRFGGRGYDDHRFDRDSRFNLRFDFGSQYGTFDRWERGWGYNGYDRFRYQQPLNYWQLTRRLEAQGFYGVRDLRPSGFGFGYRAFAFTGRGRPVMLRINPYTGRVLDVRYVGY